MESSFEIVLQGYQFDHREKEFDSQLMVRNAPTFSNFDSYIVLHKIKTTELLFNNTKSIKFRFMLQIFMLSIIFNFLLTF